MLVVMVVLTSRRRGWRFGGRGWQDSNLIEGVAIWQGAATIFGGSGDFGGGGSFLGKIERAGARFVSPLHYSVVLLYQHLPTASILIFLRFSVSIH
jgi:hypothetical protein